MFCEIWAGVVGFAIVFLGCSGVLERFLVFTVRQKGHGVGVFAIPDC